MPACGTGYGTLPGVPLAAPIVLGAIAVVLLATALSLKARLKPSGSAGRARRAWSR
ncbi:hypothetical protein Scinn_51530 [Streptomyces virginiae]|uniref:Uncharacterized protein n=1 Tax=Streptomyces virginiae TaxID=1961 RepID=A0ABQ3NSC8_STRVG|nr:hypothetical protein Scinn_51530 [Streptomyces virginiae]